MSEQHSNDSSRTDPTRALEVEPPPPSAPYGPETHPVDQLAPWRGRHHLGHTSPGRAAARPAPRQRRVPRRCRRAAPAAWPPRR